MNSLGNCPRVTVLMAVYNGQRYLRSAIDSILTQTFREFEFLIINDGSSDDTRKIILSFTDPRIRLVDNSKNIGLTRSLNRGLALARGDLVARQDADDISLPNRLTNQVVFLDAHPEVAVLGTQYRNIGPGGKSIPGIVQRKAVDFVAVMWQLIFDSPFVHTSVVFRRAVVWDKLGGYDECCKTSQDYDMWTRTLVTHKGCNLPDALVCFRSHGESVSSRYNTESMATVRRALRFNIYRYLEDEEMVERWLDLWIAVNNSAVVRETQGIGQIVPLIETIFTAFCKCYPDATLHPEVTAIRSNILTRVACNYVPFDRTGAVTAYKMAYTVSPATVLQTLPRFLFRYIVGDRFSRSTSRALDD